MLALPISDGVIPLRIGLYGLFGSKQVNNTQVNNMGLEMGNTLNLSCEKNKTYCMVLYYYLFIFSKTY